MSGITVYTLFTGITSLVTTDIQAYERYGVMQSDRNSLNNLFIDQELMTIRLDKLKPPRKVFSNCFHLIASHCILYSIILYIWKPYYCY